EPVALVERTARSGPPRQLLEGHVAIALEAEERYDDGRMVRRLGETRLLAGAEEDPRGEGLDAEDRAREAALAQIALDEANVFFLAREEPHPARPAIEPARGEGVIG